MGRAEELAAALDALRGRLALACASAGRSPEEVTLLPVTKYFPASDVTILYQLGCREFGESREQEASAKIAELRSVTGQLPDVRWHMIGRLQRNKARAVARWVHTVQSVDSVRLAQALDRAAAAAMAAGERVAPPRVLLQVSLDGDAARGGVDPAGLGELADTVAGANSLTLAGVMAVAPLGVEPARGFAELARLHEKLLRVHPGATERSAGMSGDLEAAVNHGSTCVRVGTALMGSRPILSP
ncbi:MAG: YggS family pyridoxal phosphate-dependent enzyme [Mycobacteriaceae bacterium]|nr:YggS family pyridoxal phosphate-dependent enzyme [Mycobacteriaceae bacterium]